jgi:hypothetical protein
MKIYSKIVISLSSGKVLEEESFEYSGPMAYCGSNGGGGGGTSGQVGWPDYMEDMHEQALNSLWGLISTVQNPYTNLVAYNPQTEVGAIGTALTDYQTAVDAFDPGANWASLVDAVTSKFDTVVYDDTAIDADVTAFGALLSADIIADTLPRFRAGMRTINAVVSSAFVVGEANIEAERVRSLAKYSSEIKVKYRLQRTDAIVKVVGELLKLETTELDGQKELAHLRIEGNRIKIVANKEYADTGVELRKEEAKWDFEEYQYLANMMAGPSGGTIVPGDNRPSALQSALGGALSGAAAGHAIGGPYGAAIGGVIGLGASLF